MQENFQKISNLRDRKDFVGFVLFMEASEYAFRLPSLSDAKENIKKENGACGITPQAPFLILLGHFDAFLFEENHLKAMD